MTSIEVNYRAYLLRVWRTPEAHWRASLEDPHTGERRAFDTLDQLIAFLDDKPEEAAAGTKPPATAQTDDRSGTRPAHI